MKGLTVKFPEPTLRRLRHEARASGRSVAALVRERVEGPPRESNQSVYEIASDLVGSAAGSRKPATNRRRKFERS